MATAPSSSSFSSSDSDSKSDSSPNLPIKTPTPQTPSEQEHSSQEDENEEEEQEQVDKSPQSPPEKQKKKQNQLSTKKLSAIHRIWTLEDEITLLRALSDYHLKHGKLPPTKEYATFISTISGSISFTVTVKQLFNKMRTMKFNYNQNKKKGSNIKFSTSHDKAVFDLCSKLYVDDTNASKEEVSQETNRDVVNSAVKNDGDVVKSHFYLEGLIKDIISSGNCPRWLSTVNQVIEHIGELTAHNLKAKTKKLRIDSIRLHAREQNLIAELFEILADETVDD